MAVEVDESACYTDVDDGERVRNYTKGLDVSKVSDTETGSGN